MTVQPKFTQAQPVILDEAPVVLRFAGLFPQGLGKFKMHDERGGGDLDHVDQELSRLNQVLAGEPAGSSRYAAKLLRCAVTITRSICVPSEPNHA